MVEGFWGGSKDQMVSRRNEREIRRQSSPEGGGGEGYRSLTAN